MCNLPSVLCFTICSALSRTSTLHKKTNGQSKNFQNHIPQANSCRLSRKWNIKKVLFCETRFLYSTLLISFNGKFKRRRANDIVFSARNRLDRIERGRERERERERERGRERGREKKGGGYTASCNMYEKFGTFFILHREFIDDFLHVICFNVVCCFTLNVQNGNC